MGAATRVDSLGVRRHRWRLRGRADELDAAVLDHEGGVRHRGRAGAVDQLAVRNDGGCGGGFHGWFLVERSWFVSRKFVISCSIFSGWLE